MHATLFEALVDPNRRRIVERLTLGEAPVNDIVAALQLHQSGVSRHLRILHDAGIVKVRPAGRQRLYSLQPAPFQDLDAWLEPYRALWEERLDSLGSHLASKRRRK